MIDEFDEPHQNISTEEQLQSVNTEQPQSTTNVDVQKCTRINKVIPSLLNSIEQLQSLHETYSEDFDLLLASKRLKLIQELEPQSSADNQDIFVSDYQDNLTLALESMSSFMSSSADVDTITDEQRRKFGNISANIVIDQEAIVKIAGS